MIRHCSVFRPWLHAVTLLALLLALPVLAEPLSLEEAAQRAQQQFGGQVLDIKEVRSNNAPAFRIKLLQPSGRVKVLLMDNQGQLLSPSAKSD